jgi:hypothetical protein
MLYRPALHGNWNALRIARRALREEFSTPTVPLTGVLPNRQVFLPEPVFNAYCFHTATMVTRTRHNVTLYQLCVSCYP